MWMGRRGYKEFVVDVYMQGKRGGVTLRLVFLLLLLVIAANVFRGCGRVGIELW